jgi:ribosome biogenesis GTPase
LAWQASARSALRGSAARDPPARADSAQIASSGRAARRNNAKRTQGANVTDLIQYGYQEGKEPPEGLQPARVVEQHRDHYNVVFAGGETRAELKGSFVRAAAARDDLPCVGDFVLIRAARGDGGPALIDAVLPRRSKFSRADFYGHGLAHVKANREQLVAANFDVVFIATSLNLDFNVNRVSRYLAQAWQSGALPAVLLTKADLVEDAGERIAEVEAAAPGVPVRAISVRDGTGLDALDEYLRPGKTAVLLGMSGVGKSSLLNALAGSDVMAVKAIRESDARGRHTTTRRRLVMLPSGAMIIDTPGMRELGLVAADEGVSAGFADVEALFPLCRFSDCAHGGEPGCAVRAAIEDGSLSAERWERYAAHKREIRYLEDKAGYIADRREFFKAINAANRRNKKGGGFGE